MHKKTFRPIVTSLGLIVATSAITADADERHSDHVFLQGAVVTKHAEWSDDQIRNDYFRIVDHDLAGELVYIAANSEDMYVVDDPIDVKRSIAEFTNNLNASTFGDLHRVDSALGQLFWRRFTLPASGKHCAGFTATGSDDASDPDDRPTAIAFGYVCRSGELNSAAIDRFLGGLDVSNLPPDNRPPTVWRK